MKELDWPSEAYIRSLPQVKEHVRCSNLVEYNAGKVKLEDVVHRMEVGAGTAKEAM